MSSINFKITQAGLNATVNNDGVAVNIDCIAFGTGAYTPIGDETELAAQQDIIQLGSGVKDGNTMTIESTLTGNQDYTIREVGIFLDDGTLFAVYSHPTNAIAHKTAGSDFVFVYAFTLSGVDASTVQLTVQAVGAAQILKNATDLLAHQKDLSAHQDKANINGSSEQVFSVLAATEASHAVNKKQVEELLSSKIYFAYKRGDVLIETTQSILISAATLKTINPSGRLSITALLQVVLVTKAKTGPKRIVEKK